MQARSTISTQSLSGCGPQPNAGCKHGQPSPNPVRAAAKRQHHADTRLHRLAAGALALAITGALHAQDAPESPTDLGAVVVTGTNIRGAEPVGNAVLVVTADEIKASGKATVADFLREMPANFAGGVGTKDNVMSGQDGAVANANVSGGQGVNLRGLGSLSTLVLVDGRRVAASGFYGDFVDIANIPLTAIERMEVLLDGASAVYGSDAVGGVVNIILKRRDDGANTTIRIGGTTDGGGAEYQLGQTWGSSWDGGGLLLGYEYNRQQRVGYDDRNDIYNGADFSPQGGLNWQRIAFRVSPTANLYSNIADPNGNVIYRIPGGNGTGLTVADLVPVTDGVGVTSNPYSGVDLLPQSERHSAFLSMEQAVNDRLTLHADLRYSRRNNEYRGGVADVFDTLPTTNPHYISGIDNMFGVQVEEARFSETAKVDSFAVSIGGQFQISESWRGDATLSWSSETQKRDAFVARDGNTERLADGNIAPSAWACSILGLNSANIGSVLNPSLEDQYCAALNFEAFNPYTTQPRSQKVLDQMFAREQLEYRSTLGQATVKIDGDLVQLPGGMLRMAIGADWRRERISGDVTSGARTTRAPLVTAVGTTERDVAALFTEFAIPIVGKDNARPYLRAFDVSIAARHERYSGLGSYQTTNPKLGISLKPTDNLTLRASWGTSFHAPPMRFMYDGPVPISGGAPNDAFLAATNYYAPCDTTMVPLNGFVGTPGGSGNCSFTAIVVRGGAGPSLRPEEAETWTVGLNYQPDWAPGLRIGLDYFNLKVDDRITRIQGGIFPSILNELFTTGTTPYISNFSVRPSLEEVQSIMNSPRFVGQEPGETPLGPEDVALIAYAVQSNLAALKMDGIDFDIGYGFDTEQAGSFDFFVRGTKILHYDVQAGPGEPYVSRLDLFSALGDPLSLRTRQGVSWRKGAFQTQLTANYVTGYECRSGCFVPNSSGNPVRSPTPVKIDSWLTWDLAIDYDFGGRDGWLANSLLSFNVVNITNEAPPFIDGATSIRDAFPDAYDAANATVLGRAIALTFNKRW